MTELVDIIKIEVTLRHCLDGLRIGPLREELNSYWSEIIEEAVKPCTEKHWELRGGTIEVRTSHTGVHEIPEVGGGDN